MRTKPLGELFAVFVRPEGERGTISFYPDEIFLGRYPAEDRTAVVTRAAADTEHEGGHLQVIRND